MLTVAGVFSWSSTGVPAAVTHNRAIGSGGEEKRAWGADSAAGGRSNGANGTCCGEKLTQFELLYMEMLLDIKVNGA